MNKKVWNCRHLVERWIWMLYLVNDQYIYNNNSKNISTGILQWHKNIQPTQTPPSLPTRTMIQMPQSSNYQKRWPRNANILKIWKLRISMGMLEGTLWVYFQRVRGREYERLKEVMDNVGGRFSVQITQWVRQQVGNNRLAPERQVTH